MDNLTHFFKILPNGIRKKLTFDNSDLGHLEDNTVCGLAPAFEVVPLEEDVLGDDWLRKGDVDDLALGVEVHVLEDVGVVGQKIISSLALPYRGLGEAGSENDFLEPLHVRVTETGHLQPGDQRGFRQVDLYPRLLEPGLTPVVSGCLRVIHGVVDGVGRDVVHPVNRGVPDVGIGTSLQKSQRVGAGVKCVVLQVSNVPVQLRIVRVTGPDLE